MAQEFKQQVRTGDELEKFSSEQYAQSLARSLFFEFTNDKILKKTIGNIVTFYKMSLITDNKQLKHDNYDKRVNCSSLRKDEPQPSNLDAIKDCKIINEMVVSK